MHNVQCTYEVKVYFVVEYTYVCGGGQGCDQCFGSLIHKYMTTGHIFVKERMHNIHE